MNLKPRTAWLLIFAGFTILACLNTAHYYLDDLTRGEAGTFTRRVIEEFSGAYVSFALLPMVIWFARRFDLGKHFFRSIPAHVVGAFLYTTMHTTLLWIVRIVTFFALALGHYDYGNMMWRYPMEAAGDVFDYALLLGLIYLVMYASAARRAELKEAELEATLAETKLENLRLQLQPHFLFNTLNAISSVMYEDVNKADKMLAQVSDFMRLVLDSGGVQSVSVSEELRVERMYVDIMKTRLERNLMLAVRVEDDANDAQVPFMLLQPLLENSIRHGMGSIRTAIDLEIDVTRSNGSTVIRVSDDGVGFSPDAISGVGLSNVASRLEYMYGERASLSIEARSHGGTLATITLPFEKGNAR